MAAWLVASYLGANTLFPGADISAASNIIAAGRPASIMLA